ncbi:hypothetical protein L6452_18629 [Arctium lappa]|uniref:Uncharacterized protein n=1 Tax=Arctium lappa TaxID=4217 RepID=A0ACB9C6R1_ARCLA|nr:hypothetical protein L6452_18629 [Arctium lappa]
MGSISIPDPGEVTPPTSFDEFQRQASLMTTCTLIWKELSYHFTSLEKHLRQKSVEIDPASKDLEEDQ